MKLIALATIYLSFSVPVIQTIDILPNNQVRIYDNTGKTVASTFTINATVYKLINCDLTPKPIINNVICDLQISSQY